MAKNEERITIHYIPKNFSNGVNLLGFNLKTRNLIEGVIFGGVLGLAMYLILAFMPGFDGGYNIGSSFAVCLAGVVFGCIGINDEPISEFLINFFKYKKKKRTAFYNPRVKLETITYKDIQAKKDEKKLENRLKAKFNKTKNKFEEQNQEKVQSNQINNYFDAEKMFFKDDEGIIKKPKEYMDDNELKEYEKKQAKREKNILKLAKEIERKERYKDNG